MVIKKRGQVWVETVTYTLIAFIMIGLILSFAKPKIEEAKHKSILEQSAQMLREIDTIIQNVGEESVGNKRKIEMELKEGSLEIKPSENLIIFEMNSRYLYSEPGEKVSEGPISIETVEKGKYNEVKMTLNYSGEYNITQGNSLNGKILSKAPQPYSLYISNKGGTPTKVDIEL
ncbi:hypothetical protein B6U91_01900 [Candidatus Pacearchaeota archaeon ex4484_71]|nr:MAG: hypothetical protein B6U91_01900 [Candidatus Pacearchaeota archaeon ex4484_71]